MSSSPSGSEQELVERSIGGDTEAFGELYELYLDRLYRYVYLRVSDARLAEDLTQDIFLRAWAAIGDFDVQGGGFRAWIFRIAHNAVVDHYRERHPDLPIPESHDGSEIVPSSGEDWVDQTIDRTILLDALRQLGPEEQTLILLRLVEGLPHAEVGRILGRSTQACRVLQYRTLRKLSRLLGADACQVRLPEEAEPQPA